MNHAFDIAIDIREFEFSKDALDNHISNFRWVKEQWPLVYFIQNNEKKIGYVGESTDAFNRIGNHLGNEKRKVFSKISLIGSDKFNKSATLDIESQLIQYMSAEGSFSLQNANNGLTRHNYYQRDLYKDLFKVVWNKLIEKKIVSKSLEEIENSALFKYSPYKALNQDQYDSTLKIIESLIENKSSSIFVSGTAGTGKTILATYLLKLLTSRNSELENEDTEEENQAETELLKKFRAKYENPKIALVVAMTSLKETLQNVFDKIPGLKGTMVISPSDTFKEKYDILIVDEAHRLRQRRNISWMGAFTKNNSKLGLGNEGNELDWILANSSQQIFFYDAAQSVKPSDIPSDKFDKLISKKGTVKLALKSQMRVTGGVDYINFVDRLLNLRLNTKESRFNSSEYELLIFDSFKDMVDLIREKEAKYGLSRMIAGYSWPWVSKKNKKTKDIEIEGIRFFWNTTDKDWINSPNSYDEIGCIHTTQGYDLNYAAIIFGREITFDPDTRKIVIERKNYFDRNGAAGIRDADELKEYIINIYKTLMYRGIKGTFIYACDKNLSEYFKEAIKTFKPATQAKIISIERAENTNMVPLYDLRVAAGSFSDLQNASILKMINVSEKYRPTDDYFACKVVGESMNKKITNGSLCLFKKYTGGSREGKIVLAQHYKIQDSDLGSGYTIKEYHSSKEITEGNWRHNSIELRPLSTQAGFESIFIEESELDQFNIIGIFIGVINE
ncbi:MAG: DNA/RNA helicase domain-containing protein [Bacteroidia bacterium]